MILENIKTYKIINRMSDFIFNGTYRKNRRKFRKYLDRESLYDVDLVGLERSLSGERELASIFSVNVIDRTIIAWFYSHLADECIAMLTVDCHTHKIRRLVACHLGLRLFSSSLHFHSLFTVKK